MVGMMDRIIDVRVDDAAWRPALSNAKTLVRRAARATLADETDAIELVVVLTDNAAIRELNRQWRKKDKSTNVLSFPLAADDAPPPAPGEPRHLGDVVLARETIATEARAQGKTLGDHFTHLVVHGVLHLLGHDHINNAEAKRMEGLEIAILAKLGVANPYLAAAR